jgi:hypothetical protein
MKYSDQVLSHVTRLVVPETQRLSFAQLAAEDADHARDVEINIREYEKRLMPIVHQLRKFSGKSFPVVFERNYQRGLAKSGGLISIDFATLKKPESEMALTLAHEWGHQSMGHLANEYCAHALGLPRLEAERQADYYGGIFLGAYGYDIEEVLKIKLSMPEIDPTHGTRFDRACIIMQGYYYGRGLREGRVISIVGPDFELPLREKNQAKDQDEELVDNNARKLVK